MTHDGTVGSRYRAALSEVIGRKHFAKWCSNEQQWRSQADNIEVDALPGEFTEIRIILPRAAAFPSESKA